MGAPTALVRGEEGWRDRTVALLCAAVLLLVYNLNGDFLAVNDVTGTLYAAVSLIEDDQTDGRERVAMFMNVVPYHLRSSKDQS